MATSFMTYDRKVFLTPILGLRRYRVLLKHVWPSAAYFLHSGLNNSNTSVYTAALILKPCRKVWVGMSYASLLTTPKTITVAGSLVCIVLGTSEISADNHRSFCMLDFQSRSKFFLSGKNQKMLVFVRNLTLAQINRFSCVLQTWIIPTSVHTIFTKCPRTP